MSIIYLSYVYCLLIDPSIYVSISPGLRGKSQSPTARTQRKNPSAFPVKPPSAKDAPALGPSRGPAAAGLFRARAALRLPLWSLEGSALLRRSGLRGGVLGCQPRTRTREAAEQLPRPCLPPGKRSAGLRRQNAPHSSEEPALTSCRKSRTFPLRRFRLFAWARVESW